MTGSMGQKRPTPPRMRPAARLRSDARGSALVQFALVATPFFALLVAILQITTNFFVQEVLETVADSSVRQLLTGAAQQSNMTQSGFKTLVCSKLPSFMTCSNVMIDVRTSSTFAAVSLTTPTITYDSNGNPNNVWNYAPGVGGDITVARIMYVWQVQSGPLGFDISNMTSNRRLMTATRVFKIEPY